METTVTRELSVRRGREALGRIEDLFGHHWEIGKPLVEWPPRH